jgi:hypothetical protein
MRRLDHRTRQSIPSTADQGTGLIALHLTSLELSTHRRLFDFDKKRIAPVSDADVWRILRELRAAALLEPFRLWLVGSRLDPGNESSDVDLVLSPREGLSLTDVAIERALWYCRNFGLYVANPPCLLDPCFRAGGPALATAPLRPHTVLHTIKLFSPKLAKLIRDRRIRQFRRFGSFSIEYLRRSEDTDYYGKLPRRAFGGSLAPYLRPAVEALLTGDPA